MEDKKGIIYSFFVALRQTRAGSDIIWMDYRKERDGEEYVDIRCSNNVCDTVRVTADSGACMMYDILKHFLL